MDNRPSKHHLLALCALAAIAGGVGFVGNLAALPFVLLFPAALSAVRSAKQAMAVAFWYYAAAMHTLYVAAYDFTNGDIVITAIAPSLAFAVLSIPFWLVYRYKVIGLALAILIVTIPPVGNIGWAGLFTAAGLFFPGLGFIGIALFSILILAVYRFPVITILVPAVAVFWYLNPPVLPTSQDWTPVNTNLGSLIEAGYDVEKDFKAQKALVPIVKSQTDNNLLLSEGALGLWSKASYNLWKRYIDLDKKTIIGGGETKADNGRFYNSLILIDSDSAEAVYNSRIPVPFFMTRTQTGYFAMHDNNGVFDYRGHRYGALICYEGSITWTVLQTHFNSPELVFIASNSAWTKRTNLLSLVAVTIDAWSLLFSTPYVSAMNK